MIDAFDIKDVLAITLLIGACVMAAFLGCVSQYEANQAERRMEASFSHEGKAFSTARSNLIYDHCYYRDTPATSGAGHYLSLYQTRGTNQFYVVQTRAHALNKPGKVFSHRVFQNRERLIDYVYNEFGQPGLDAINNRVASIDGQIRFRVDITSPNHMKAPALAA